MKNTFPKHNEILPLLRCPECQEDNLKFESEQLDCVNCGSIYPFSGCRPVLLKNDNSLFDSRDYLSNEGPEQTVRKEYWQHLIPNPSVNLASTKVIARLREVLDAEGNVKILVVGGGSQRSWLDGLLKVKNPHQVIYSDIDSAADVDLFCDGHDLPFKSDTFDAVITTAVLEHVMYPERVASEITRVLKAGGVLYSELPFMQQVHEGAYDFTRYTLSGHRRIFNSFEELDSGMVAGPGTALVWAIENFFLAFTSTSSVRKITKVLVRLLFSWVKYFDYMLEGRPEAMDGASCTYFFGKKVTTKITDDKIIASYVGAKHLRHT